MAAQAGTHRISINWPLWLGTLLVSVVALLAIRGPGLAPKDPLEENLIVKDPVDGEWFIPPFPAFELSDFPLGSDEFGRDLYSRLLYAIRPTLEMVLVVACVRLLVGTLIGLAAGYSLGRFGGFFDTLISGALALPGLLVALGAIAIVGVELGVLAFVIGLSLTGWAETARIVREQTRTIRNEVYVEAAHALGATDPQIVFRHVVRQIRAMLLMLFAFEVGSTLMLTSGLGFLGYYIGGDVWVDISDFVARRTSGNPELGQMLATGWVRLTEPWGLVAVGSVVFTAVLGFNLLGEGLRLRISPEARVLRIRWLSEWLARAQLNLEQAWHPIGGLLFGTRLAMTAWIALLGGGLGYGAVSLWQSGFFDIGEAQVSMLFEDSGATATPLPTALPSSPGAATPTGTVAVAPVEPVLAWTFEDASGFAGDPAVDSAGNVFVAGLGGTVHALAPDGAVRWELELSPAPAFSPSFGPDGLLYIPDKGGGLVALTTEGEIVWQFIQAEAGFSSASQVFVAPDGTLLYTISRGVSGVVQAVWPDGSSRWQAAVETVLFRQVPSTNSSGDLIFLANEVHDAETGIALAFNSQIVPQAFFVGADGQDYLRVDNTVFAWTRAGETIELGLSVHSPITDEAGGLVPTEVFVTADQRFIFLYRSTSLWMDAEGTTLFQTVNPDGHLIVEPISLEADLSLFACGTYRFVIADPPTEVCFGFGPVSEEAYWRITFGTAAGLQDTQSGSARTPEGFIYSSREGKLYAVELIQ